MKTHALTVYYSWSENTKKIAEQIHSYVGGDILRIVPIESYPTDYRECVNQAIDEVRAKAAPKLMPFSLDIAQYDTVFIGSPIWCGSFAPPLRSFLQQYSLSGKTLCPFCTHGGGGQRNFTDDICNVCNQSSVKDTLVLYGDGGNALSEQVHSWLHRISCSASDVKQQ